jgi:hypothetical protein
VNIQWQTQHRFKYPLGTAEGNVYNKPGMSHYIPCPIAE